MAAVLLSGRIQRRHHRARLTLHYLCLKSEVLPVSTEVRKRYIVFSRVAQQHTLLPSGEHEESRGTYSATTPGEHTRTQLLPPLES